MADVSNKLKNLSLQNRNNTLSKAHTLLTAYIKRIESLIASPEEHYILVREQKKQMSFQEVKLREGKVH